MTHLDVDGVGESVDDGVVGDVVGRRTDVAAVRPDGAIPEGERQREQRGDEGNDRFC